MRLVAILTSVLLLAATSAESMAICGEGRRVTCVVDGDTFWLQGEKVRIADMDAPEIKGRCRSERDLAARATRRLAELLDAAGLSLDRRGTDDYGRTLANVAVADQDIGEKMIGEGLARPWRGHREPWC